MPRRQLSCLPSRAGDPPLPWQHPSASAFKFSPLRGVKNTARYFHDNSARTLDDVVRHYASFFAFVTNGVITSRQDQADIVAYLKLL